MLKIFITLFCSALLVISGLGLFFVLIDMPSKIPKEIIFLICVFCSTLVYFLIRKTLNADIYGSLAVLLVPAIALCLSGIIGLYAMNTIYGIFAMLIALIGYTASIFIRRNDALNRKQ